MGGSKNVAMFKDLPDFGGIRINNSFFALVSAT